MPKAPSPFSDEEDEKTTIESGWEEEASTTVEQGEVAEKIRSLGLDRLPMGTPATGEGSRRQNITNVTSTNAGSMVDEPTVDDQRANAALSMITPPTVLARLVITMGNDTGQEIEIIPGKSYTIGRAIDNDVVLTDIAVSRKHFDLRHENGTWVLADRGSGNGTVVNGNLEDQPFMLANGDSIEIGNTTFKFDNPNGVPRNVFNDNGITNGFSEAANGITRNAAPTYDVDLEEEEPSTVAGKPVRDVLGDRSFETPQQHAAPLNQRVRPRTVPPPAPLPRPRPLTHPPPATYPLGSQGALPPSLQPTISPHQGMQAMPQPSYQGMVPLQQSRPMHTHQPAHQPTMLADAAMPMPNVMPTTIPGQGPPMHPSTPHMHQMPFTYPNVADHAQHAKMLVVTNQPLRDATAHVPPTPYSGMQAMQPQAYEAPQISRRTKLLLGGAGLTLLAAIATVAIIKGSSGGSPTPPEDPAPTTKGSATAPSRPVVQPIKEEPKKVEPKSTRVDPKDPPKVAAKDPPKVADPPKDPPKVADPPKVVATDPPKDPPKVAPKDPPKDPPKVAAKDPPKDPPKVAAKDPPKVAAKDPPKVAAKDPPKDPPKVAAKDPPKREPKPPKKEPKPPRVAVADPPPKAGGDTSQQQGAADGLFRQKKFKDAAATLRSAAANASGAESGRLRNLAGTYEQFGRQYNAGMAPSAPPMSAWEKLKSARSFDSANIFREEIDARLIQIAPSAAMAFLGAKNYFRALEAAKLAQDNGKTDSATIVRGQINEYAATLYAEASKEIESNPKEAKAKLQQIKALADPKSSIYAKAVKLLSGS